MPVNWVCPYFRRSELLAQLTRGDRTIAVSGTHGKTTVTALLKYILMEAGFDLTVVLGGEYRPFGGNARVEKERVDGRRGLRSL